MFRLTRTSSEPASPLKIMIAKPDGEDAGLTNGGSYVLDPGDTVQVDAYVAGVIMGDPEMAKHFECLPPWGQPALVETAPVEAVQADAEQAPAPVATHPKRRGGNPSW